MIWINDYFYDIKHLSLDEKKDLLIDAKKRSYHWHVDLLLHLRRERIKYYRFKNILKKLDNVTHFVFISRGGYYDGKKMKPNRFLNQFIIEIGFCTKDNYFLFINLSTKHIDYFIEKYKLYKVL